MAAEAVGTMAGPREPRRPSGVGWKLGSSNDLLSLDRIKGKSCRLAIPMPTVNRGVGGEVAGKGGGELFGRRPMVAVPPRLGEPFSVASVRSRSFGLIVSYLQQDSPLTAIPAGEPIRGSVRRPPFASLHHAHGPSGHDQRQPSTPPRRNGSGRHTAAPHLARPAAGRPRERAPSREAFAPASRGPSSPARAGAARHRPAAATPPPPADPPHRCNSITG